MSACILRFYKKKSCLKKSKWNGLHETKISRKNQEFYVFPRFIKSFLKQYCFNTQKYISCENLILDSHNLLFSKSTSWNLLENRKRLYNCVFRSCKTVVQIMFLCENRGLGAPIIIVSFWKCSETQVYLNVVMFYVDPFGK